MISELCALADDYLKEKDVKEIYRAYLFGAQAHEGQLRISGEPYIEHPIKVAHILAQMRMDPQTIVAAILHDVMEDTQTDKQQLKKLFGSDVAELVDGVSKLTKVSFANKAHAQAENFRKMMLAMARDIRVILIKLADRLHNMRTLGALAIPKQMRISKETLEIYAPIAYRLGLNNVAKELEELGFIHMHPHRYRVLSAALRKSQGNRKRMLRKISVQIKKKLRQESIEGEVEGRDKHLFSLYKKMRIRGISFNEVQDIYGFRIKVSDADLCYRILGVVHSLYKPIPGKFKDYIAMPKTNGYQSLHTTVIGPNGRLLEIQIRTHQMNQIAEHGIAAHWMYKSGKSQINTAQQKASKWLKELLEVQSNSGDSVEFLEHVKVDLFPKEVYVFTPAGDIMALARGATPIDLAYAVHTDVGNNAIAAKVDGEFVSLSSALRTGQHVEIVTASWGKPNASWLNFAITGRARAGIRHRLKSLKQGEARKFGKRLFKQQLAKSNTTLKNIGNNQIAQYLKAIHLSSLDELYEQIGLGKQLASLVIHRLLHSDDEFPMKIKQDKEQIPVIIAGTEGTVVDFAKCCYPIPGDRIFAQLNAGRGLVVHSTDCSNTRPNKDHPESCLPVAWAAQIEREFSVHIRVSVRDKKGVLAIVTTALTEQNVNIENVFVTDRETINSTIHFVINVRDRNHLAKVIRRLRRLDVVSKIIRPNHL